MKLLKEAFTGKTLTFKARRLLFDKPGETPDIKVEKSKEPEKVLEEKDVQKASDELLKSYKKALEDARLSIYGLEKELANNKKLSEDEQSKIKFDIEKLKTKIAGVELGTSFTRKFVMDDYLKQTYPEHQPKDPVSGGHPDAMAFENNQEFKKNLKDAHVIDAASTVDRVELLAPEKIAEFNQYWLKAINFGGWKINDLNVWTKSIADLHKLQSPSALKAQSDQEQKAKERAEQSATQKAEQAQKQQEALEAANEKTLKQKMINGLSNGTYEAIPERGSDDYDIRDKNRKYIGTLSSDDIPKAYWNKRSGGRPTAAPRGDF